jgi:hypothetical protein
MIITTRILHHSHIFVFFVAALGSGLCFVAAGAGSVNEARELMEA